MKASTTVIAAAAAFAGSADAFWRMECRGRVGLARIDPMVSPNDVAQHVHAIHGSSAFSESATYNDVMNGECTSCAAKEDKSVYWHPALYFQHDNGQYELVPQVGGMLAYYLLNPQPGVTGNITAFPEGFRMIAGTSTRREYTIAGSSYLDKDPDKSFWAQLGQTTQADLEQRAIGFNCMNYQKTPEGAFSRHYLPDKAYLDENCADGIRFEISFGSCWDGKNLDSANHRSHVAYPDLVLDGNCPDSHPVRLPGLMYEIIWDTAHFAGQPGQFVISNGDVQGFGFHADFIMGWDGELLQNAVDTCTSTSGLVGDCPLFTIQSEQEQNQCQLEKLPQALVKEVVTGMVGSVLPGSVTIQYGPGNTPVAVPTVSYAPGTTGVGVGGIFKESPSATPAAATTPDAAPTPASSQPAGSPAIIGGLVSPDTTPDSAPTTAPETTAAPTTPVPTTPAPTTPAPTVPTDDGLPIVSTQYITAGNVVSEVVWKEAVVYVTSSEDVTVTVTVQQPTSSLQAVRRLRRGHGHDHFHRHLRQAGRR